MTSTWQAYREPFRTTLLRTIGIAVVVGGVLAWRYGSLYAWPLAALLVFWFSFGGHWVELWFLNWLRPRLPHSRVWQIAVRLAVWFVGGVGLGLGVGFTMRLFALTREGRSPRWWVAGIVFIAVEFIAHLVLALIRRPNFYNGEG
jgi:hypothetical protein